MRLFGTFGLFALLLAMSGIYAVLAYAVGQRTREIGVRRALGARDEGILRMVLGQGGRQLLLGLVIGLVLALMFGRLLANLLFELPSFDPVTFGGVAIVLALVSVAAGWIPARRALRVEPMVALRYE
jgi:ABC-type antimicrobial peptide transport system permease subunit